MNCRVLVPVYTEKITEDEELSVGTIRQKLSRYKLCFIAPASLDLSGVVRDGEMIERFGDEYFHGIEGYNQLLKSSEFYERFTGSRYVLICQLDCLVLSDELESWINKDFDYIGAPWFKPKKSPEDGLWRSGNGGFSLRNVEAHLRVLRMSVPKGSIYRLKGSVRLRTKNAKAELGTYRKKMFWHRLLHPKAEMNNVEDEMKRFPYHEDVFWSFEAPKFDPNFKVATADQALPFSFEVAPRWCFEKNGRRLPFGCHAWPKYDREFWMKILNKSESLGGVTPR